MLSLDFSHFPLNAATALRQSNFQVDRPTAPPSLVALCPDYYDFARSPRPTDGMCNYSSNSIEFLNLSKINEISFHDI